MALSPLLQVREIRRRRSSAGVSIAYFCVLLFGFALWIAYGVASCLTARLTTHGRTAHYHAIDHLHRDRVPIRASPFPRPALTAKVRTAIRSRELGRKSTAHDVADAIGATAIPRRWPATIVLCER
jgi:uncharacterized protein with PQ loop repeat